MGLDKILYTKNQGYINSSFNVFLNTLASYFKRMTWKVVVQKKVLKIHAKNRPAVKLFKVSKLTKTLFQFLENCTIYSLLWSQFSLKLPIHFLVDFFAKPCYSCDILLDSWLVKTLVRYIRFSHASSFL